MDRIKGVLRQLRVLFSRRVVDRDLDDELAFHVEMATAENERLGMAPEEARRAALIAFGGRERYAERVREVRWTRWVEDMTADVRYAARMLGRRPGFAGAVIATLGLGIGGTTAIFSVVDGLFLRAPDGVSDAGALRRISIARDAGAIRTGPDGGPGSWLDFEAMRAGAPAFVEIAAILTPRWVDLGRGSDADRVRAMAVSSGYFEMLRVTPALGRLFLDEDDAVLAAHPVAVISHAMWRTRFGARPDVLGSSLLLNGEQVEIVGVIQQGFSDLYVDPVDVWLPTAMAGPMGMFITHDWRTEAEMLGIGFIGRLRPGFDADIAETQATAALRHAAETYPSLDPTPHVQTTSLTIASARGGAVIGSVSLWLVLVATIVLIIACANVVNLLLTRALTRRRELAVRLALGAGRWRVARQQLTESLVLALLGGAAGATLAFVGVRMLNQFPLPPSAGRLDARLLAFTLVVSLFSAVLFGVLPSARSVRFDPVNGLKDSRVAGSIASARTKRTLIVLQVALSLILLVGAGLFVRSLREVHAIASGVDLERLITARVDLRRAGYTGAEREAFYERAIERVTKLPQVERAAIVHFEPFNRSGMAWPWHVPGRQAPPRTEGPYVNMAGVGYFETAGTRLLAGRTFDETDRANSEPVAVVNEAMSMLMADNGNVVGRCIPLGEQVESAGCTRIIGVVETQRRRYLSEKPVPLIFLSRAQAPNAVTWGGPALLVRTRGDAAGEAARVRAALQGLSSDLPYVNVRPLEELVLPDVVPFRLGATLFSLFGLLALALAALGLHGVLGYYVTERTPEIGIRRSLGAQLPGIVSLIMRQGMVPVIAGILIGLAAAVASTRFLAALLFGVNPRDPLIFAFSALFLLVVGTMASLLPAVRAARVSPMLALRSD